jgi:uncharacterized membrane protein
MMALSNQNAGAGQNAEANQNAVADTFASYRVTFKPNCSLSANGKIKVVLLLTLIPCCIAIGFSLVGAWMVLPFVGLEIIALGYAFYHVNSHSSDYESISIDGDRLLVERGNGQHVSQHILNPYWASVVRHELPNGELHIGLLSHGKEIEVGHFLTRKQRELLAQQLQKRTGTFYRS